MARQTTKEPLLIVEDDPVTRRLFEAVAEIEGYQVYACEDAERGWEVFQRHNPRIVVLDWLLRGMDGLALARLIRQHADGPYVTILMVTTQERPQEMEEALKAGVTYYLTKPVKRDFFQAWLAAARKNSDDMRQLQEHQEAREKHRRELESLNAQLESAITRANEMAAEASRAYIEVNQIFKTVAGGILLIDTRHRILRFNEAFLRMAGVSSVKAKTAKCYEVFPSTMCHSPACPMRRIKAGEEVVENDIERPGPNGGPSHYHVLATPFRGPAGDMVGIVKHISDVTSRVRAEKALQESEQRYKELSIIDELTGLYNKRYFNKNLIPEVERARRYGNVLSLLMMDVDNFKHFNDTYGHPQGDRVLAAMGELLRNTVRLNDLACRIGGEEFAVILPETTGENALGLAERLRRKFAELEFHPTEGVAVQKTMSIGVAEFETDETPESLLARADSNLYAAKEAGRNRCILR
ncbi:GGDEF domain-containing response regulator [Desulfurivibrio alkaliphilus]|uniref:diguanylate cyclase n=1 Tax=Desulfurivibrio alkaliphilus (strain DSM 19089 / UNIQEM U267 / AHT2) TaxID=589865 RepID=D6Z523_DESAT|nr:diguanylate cyclase [Desulfurivibrio alkaliphilus]ADH86648.1 response regulator receiver modulated diguanylate cyclase [Desulfurivibrio alkaliphilus AHT 2]